MKKLILIMFISSFLAYSQKLKPEYKLQFRAQDTISILDAPFIASFHQNPSSYGYRGIAVIIDEKWLLTTTDLIMSQTGDYSSANYKLFENEYENIDLNISVDYGRKDNGEIKYLEIDKIIFKDQYLQNPNKKDMIALIKLKSPIQFNNEVQPIDLISSTQELNELIEDQYVVSYDMQTIRELDSVKLAKLSLPLLDISTANDWISESFPKQFNNDLFSEDDILIGNRGGGYGLCLTDRGAPMIVESNQTKYLAGIYSWTAHCYGFQSPYFFTNISSHYDWIEETIEKYSSEDNEIVNIVDIFAGRIYENCFTSSTFDVKCVAKINSIDEFEHFQYDIVLSGSNNSKTYKNAQFKNDVNPESDFFNFYEQLEFEFPTDSLKIELKISKINNIEIESKSISKNIEIIPNSYLMIEHNLEHDLNDLLEINNNTTDNNYYIDLKRTGEYQDTVICISPGNVRIYFNNFNPTSGYLKIYDYEPKTGTKKLIYYWKEKFEQVKLPEIFDLKFPLTDYSNLKFEFDGEIPNSCNNNTLNPNRYYYLQNTGNYAFENITLMASNGTTSFTKNIDYISSGSIENIMLLNEFDLGYNELLITILDKDGNILIDGNNYDHTIKKDIYFNTDSYKTVSFSDKNEMGIEIILTNQKTGNKFSKLLLPHEGESNVCIPYGCYEAEIFIYEYDEELNYKDQIITIKDANGIELAFIDLLPMKLFETNNYELCIDYPGNVSLQSKDVTFSDNTLYIGKSNVTTKIYNINGELLISEKVQQVNCSELINGIYFYTIESEKNKVTGKFIKL